MAELQFLGTGTSNGIPMIGCTCPVCRSENIRDKRLRCSAYIKTDQGDKILIDCSPDFRQQALKYKVHHIDSLLITHAHFDHIGGIDELRQINYLMKSPIDIYGGTTHIDEIRERVSYLFRDTQTGGGKAQINLNYLKKGELVKVSRTPVLPLPLKHGDLDIFGFRLGSLIYITDTSSIPESTMDLLVNPRPSILIINALRFRNHSTHFSFDQALKIAENVKAEQTYFIHMTHDILHRDVEAQLPENIHLAYDGLTLTFDS